MGTSLGVRYGEKSRYEQELMKEGASNCVERHLTIATLPFYGHILKWGISVVFIANALRRTPRVCVISRAVRRRTYVYIPFNSKFNFTPCRLHLTSNGNSISESHPEYEGHAHHYVIT